MANYNCYSRTNYFKVTDESKLKELVEKIGAELFEGVNGTWGFGNYESITSYYDEEQDEDVEIFEELQSILPDGEIAVIAEVGYEKLRYLNAYSVVITNSDIRSVDLDTAAVELANEMLGTDDFVLNNTY